MNCTKCNLQLRDGAKFCTSCGTPTMFSSATKSNGEVTALCLKCGVPLKPNAKFCTACGEQTAEHPQVRKEMSVVKQRIFWNVQQGEIARRINESEFIQYDSALGIVINEGTTAYIHSEGKQIAEIKGGAYNFVDPKELDKILESRIGGASGWIKDKFRFAINLVAGEKVKDKKGLQAPNIKEQDSLDAVITCMKAGSLLSLSLKLDKDFELIFGSTQSEINNYADFVPMLIKTKYLDVNIGVRALFKITDFQKFSQHYLSDNNVVSTSLLADKLTPIIKAAVQEAMYDVEQIESKLPSEVLDNIRNKITSASHELMYGISLERIVEVCSENEDIERFRALSRELYLSDKELDYLHRTNEFKNRLAAATANQNVNDRFSELELTKRLTEINKDELLHKDELKKFEQALHINEIIRNAHGDEQLAVAMLEIETRSLLKGDEYNILVDSVRKGDYNREMIFDLMKIRGDAERNKAQKEVEQVELERVRQQRLGMADIEVQEQKLRDDYVIERDRKARSAEMDSDERAADSSFERLRKIKELERLDKADDNQHELNKRELEIRELSAQGNFTAEQLMAIAANKNLDPAAAVKFAESFSAGKDSVKIEEMGKARIDDMKEMMRMMAEQGNNRINEKEEQKNEYKAKLTHQEDRMDKTQDRALDYTTRNNISRATVLPPPPSQSQQAIFYLLGANNESTPYTLQQLHQLIGQGLISATALILPPNGSSWVAVATVNELAHLFISSKNIPANKICSNCGNTLSSEALFCNECGKNF